MGYLEAIKKLITQCQALEWKQFKFEFIIDTREPESLKKHFAPLKFVTFANRDVGDFTYLVDGYPIFVIERKSESDLSSALGKRFRSQKYRLLQLPMSTRRILYLIEDSFVDPRYAAATETMLAAMVNAFLRDRMGVLRTKHELDTVAFLLTWIPKIWEFGTGYLQELQQETIKYALVPELKQATDQKDDQDIENELTLQEREDDPPSKSNVTQNNYAKSLLTSRKQNLTPTLCFQLQLAQITGFSVEKALAIVEKFGSMVNLCETIRSKPKPEAIKLLAKLEYSPEAKKKRASSEPYSRKIGPACAARLYAQLLGHPAD
jgi:ERCC4-type nuclease